MAKRRLKRQLNLAQVVMLGTAGAIAAELFVITGHAAGIAGPATVLAILVAALMTLSVALNYCELATTFPETGGAMTYVREAFGNGLLSYVVGSFDCLSSTFYSALSAVGFAYSLRVFIPGLPLVPTALATVAFFTLLNLLGVDAVGNVQILLGGILLLFLGTYIVGGLFSPAGFRREVFLSGGGFFVEQGLAANLGRILRTVALIYTAFVGFEVIADDAEEVANPNRTIPRGILLSLGTITVVYTLVILVALGTVPWRELTGSETALTDTAARSLPGWGVPMMAAAGVIASLTTVNTAMLSATREAFTLSRDGAWPRALSKMGRFRTPFVAVLAVGTVIALVAAIGVVDFLSYISSSGYLFVLIWASLALPRLRRLHPELARPFKAPLFPLTAYAAAGGAALIIASTDWRALLFGAGLLGVLAILYYARGPVERFLETRVAARQEARDRILIAVANPVTARKLAHLATMLARAGEDTSICVLKVMATQSDLQPELRDRLVGRLARRSDALLRSIADEALAKNVPLFTRMLSAPTVAEGVLRAMEPNVKLLLMGWPGPLEGSSLSQNPVKVVLQRAKSHTAVFLDRQLGAVKRILVPVGGGPHSRLAIRLAYELAEEEDAEMTALTCFCEDCDGEELENRMGLLRETVEDVLGTVPDRIVTRLSHCATVTSGVLEETTRQDYDLLVVGASEEWADPEALFGRVDDELACRVPCSVLMVRRYEAAVMSWIRRQAKSVASREP